MFERGEVALVVDEARKVKGILTKLDLTSRSQLAVWVVESGLRDDIQTDSD